MALAVFWIATALSVLCLSFVLIEIITGGPKPEHRTEMTAWAIYAVLFPPFVWGAYRLIRWIAVGSLAGTEKQRLGAHLEVALEPGLWPPMKLMALAIAWTFFAHLIFPHRDQTFTLFHINPNPETLLYVVVFSLASHLPLVILIFFGLYQLARRRWQRAVNALLFIAFNLIIYAAFLANKPALPNEINR